MAKGWDLTGFVMARKKKKQERHFELSIYLVKAGVTDHGKVVPLRSKMRASMVKNGTKNLGTLYVSYKSQGHPPSWTDLLRGGVDDAFLDDLKPRSVSGVLLIEQDDRMFAITFGHGHRFVDSDQIVTDFGLKTTLNLVDADAIRQVDRRKLDSTGRIAVEQSGIEIPILQFGLDPEQDLLRRVTARPRDADVARQLSGKEALRATVPVKLDNLSEILSKFLKISQEVTYKKTFGFIDNIAEVRDEALILKLQVEVVRLANDDTARNVFMAPPDVIDWNLTQGLRYFDDPDDEIRPDIDLVMFKAVALDGTAITWDALERHRIYVVDNDDNVSNSWPAYRCLYADFQYERNVYVLTEGMWYHIDKNFSDRVSQNFAGIPDCTLTLPAWTQENEGDYNEHAANISGGYLQLLDKKLIQFPPGGDKMEFCDLLSRDKHLVHVKQFTSSSGISHLCAQAGNSAEYLKMDPDFRGLVNTKLTDLGVPAAFHVPTNFTAAHAGQYEVVFAIAGKHAHLPIEIPFFSKVSVYNAARRCLGMGFKVSKIKVVKDALAGAAKAPKKPKAAAAAKGAKLAPKARKKRRKRR